MYSTLNPVKTVISHRPNVIRLFENYAKFSLKLKASLYNQTRQFGVMNLLYKEPQNNTNKILKI